MKIRIPLLAMSWCLLAAGSGHGQTLDWGSEVFSDLVDSQGDTLDSVFVFELGAFVDGFVPDETNVGLWHQNWMVFDQASYNASLGYFTSTVTMNDDGSSSYNPSSISFEGLSAYLWIRNSTDPVEGTEWLLARAASWVFPNAVPGCCDNEPPLQWSVSDLATTDVPVWGNQGGIEGAGHYTVTGNYTLQTYTFIPEPSSGVLLLFSAAMLMRRRRA